jgi:hypothetical protein
MFELALRTGAALVLLGAGWAGGSPTWDSAWRLAVLWLALGAAGWLLERRGIRSPGLSGWLAVGDAAAIAWALGATGMLGQIGFLVLAPCAWAASRHGANATAMAPLAASALLVAENFAGGWAFGQGPLTQAAAVLLVGLVLGRRSMPAPEKEPAPGAAPEPAREPVAHALGIETARHIQLRESYRRLRDHAEQIEGQRRTDRLQLRLLEASRLPGPVAALAAEMGDALNVEGASVYALSESGRSLVVRGSSGSTGNLRTAFDVESDGALAGDLGRALRTNDSAPTATIPLRDKGRIVGMVCLRDARAERLKRAEVLVEGAAPFLARLLHDLEAREREARRLAIAELLYEVATVASGAGTPTTLAARVVRELWPAMVLDHLGIWLVDGGDAIAAATAGAGTRVMEALRFPEGEGLDGWLAAGAPEVLLANAHEGGPLDRQEALRRRIGSLAVLPIRFGERPFGFLVATTHRPDGVDRPMQESLRVVAAELGQAMGRLTRPAEGVEGLASPAEFQRALSARPGGCFVFLEPLDLDALLERFGAPSVDLALHRLALRLRASLPAGALLCRRPERDFVAFLRGVEIEFAQRWANDAAASAAMLPVTTPDGRDQMPLGLRARASRLAGAAAEEVLLHNAG